jgi:GTP cyclohydrolase IA
MRKIGLNEFNKMIAYLAPKVEGKYRAIYGVPRGGIPVAIALSAATGIPMVDSLDVHTYGEVLIVDDIVDSGTTRLKYSEYDFAALCCKNTTPKEARRIYSASEETEWVEFFWEVNESPATDAVTRLIEYIGEDPCREGLLETPKRVIKAYEFMFSGYKQHPEDIIKTFDSGGYDQMVLLKDIEMYSFCEHHMVPFFGKAHVAYIPNDRVIGISKLARLVDMYSRRLQIQERLGQQVVDALMKYLKPRGAACIIEAQHLCMRMRGVEKQNSEMVTSSLRGLFLDDSDIGRASREELMRLIK